MKKAPTQTLSSSSMTTIKGQVQGKTAVAKRSPPTCNTKRTLPRTTTPSSRHKRKAVSTRIRKRENSKRADRANSDKKASSGARRRRPMPFPQPRKVKLWTAIFLLLVMNNPNASLITVEKHSKRKSKTTSRMTVLPKKNLRGNRGTLTLETRRTFNRSKIRHLTKAPTRTPRTIMRTIPKKASSTLTS